MAEISIARALTELKTLDARIQNKIGSTNFVAGVKKSSKKINNVYTREEYIAEVKSNYESIVAMIERKKILKAAIVGSNAITKLMIGMIEYTVANAIERKSSINLDRQLLQQLEGQYKNMNAQVNRNNELVEQNLNNLLASSVSSDKKDAGDMNGFAEAYRQTNSFEIINPLKLQVKIEKLRKEIEDFETEVDAALTESNVLTKIEFED
jgi:hypothetical protein